MHTWPFFFRRFCAGTEPPHARQAESHLRFVHACLLDFEDLLALVLKRWQLTARKTIACTVCFN